MYTGKLIWKLKKDGWEAQSVDLFARTAFFATLHQGGLVEPLYRLHAARLKLLLSSNRDWGLLSRYFKLQTLVVH